MGVDWTYGAEHMWDNHKVTVMEANEVVGDIDALWFDPDPASRSGASVRVLGYSHSRRVIVTVILVSRDEGGYWRQRLGIQSVGSAPVPRRAVSDGRKAVC